jgi:predicted phosphate transport protein (TIGR00153 family)
MALNLFGRLMPAQANFTTLFCAQAKSIRAAAQALRRLIGDPADIDGSVARIRAIEVEADAAARRVFIAANRTFNAPIDREDILALGHELDDVVDLIEDAAKAIQRYDVRNFSPEMHRMVDSVIRAADAIEKAMPLLDAITREYRSILALCEEIGRIEGEADDCLDAGLGHLRQGLRAGEIDAVAYMDRKEIYELLEAVVDKCDDVADALETITAKHV